MTKIDLTGKKVAVLLPCYNEEVTIGKVVKDFKEMLPDATIYVYDNNSSDRTVEVAREAGAEIGYERRQGKGNVVRRMFHEVEADYYVMADGDDTYPAENVYDLMKPVVEGRANMSVGGRLHTFEDTSFRPLHQFGNKMIRGLINLLFRAKMTDVLSGYRCFDRETAKTLPLLSSGFEIETELTIQSLDKGLIVEEISFPYRSRPEGSVSKLNTYTDGILVVTTIFRIFKDYRPLSFFLSLGAILFFVGLIIGLFPIVEYFKTGMVERLPSAVLAASLMMLSFVASITGIILDTMNRRHKEHYELMIALLRRKL